jgi:glycosyltransferase involved in cell wall biosynthesis
VTPPLVSFCLPTFQRAHLLAPTLARLAEVLSRTGWLEHVELCVSDNASADETPAVLDAFQPPGLRIKRVRQVENIGFARNLHAVHHLAQGEYLLSIGDDDALAADACATLERALADRPALALFPTLPDQPLDGDWSARAGEQWLQGGVKTLRMLGLFHLTFLGNFVVRRADYLAADEPRFQASLYPHVPILLRLLERERAKWMPEPLFQFEEQGKSWNQPLLTAVDLARIYTDELFVPRPDPAAARAFYARTIRSIPRAFLHRKLGRPDQPSNPYASLRLRNLLSCYRASARHQYMAAAAWLAGSVLPAAVLLKLIGEKPRKVIF